MNEIAQLDPEHVATLVATLKGKRLEHFQRSVALINESLAAGGWVGRAAQQSSKGFGQGFPHPRGGGQLPGDDPLYEAAFAVRHGSCHKSWADMLAAGATPTELQRLSPKQPIVALVAWVEVCYQATQARKKLDALRKLPQVTPIGLSPKVTETLTGMGVDLELPSIKPTAIGVRWVQARYPAATREYNREQGRYIMLPHPQAGELRFSVQGEPVMEPEYYLDWTPGTVMGASRYADHDCEACGKTIPSGEFVAIEADCKINGHVGLYLGRDCAKNIFGVKDEGLKGKR